MNQRIRELAEQAGSTHKQNLGVYQFYSDELEKFAELILQDIKNLFGDERISLHYLEQPCCEDSVRLLLLKILEHFGMKK